MRELSRVKEEGECKEEKDETHTHTLSARTMTRFFFDLVRVRCKKRVPDVRKRVLTDTHRDVDDHQCELFSSAVMKHVG